MSKLAVLLLPLLVLGGCAAPPRNPTVGYLTVRKAEIAQSAAREADYERAVRRARRELLTVDADSVRRGERLPVDTAETLVYTAGALERARVASQDIERRKADIVDDLYKIARMRTRAGGFTATLAAPKLFANDDLKLAPSCAELDAIASAVLQTAPGASVTIESRADSTSGFDLRDQQVAQRRADVVAAYLASHGIARDRIRAVGLPPRHFDPQAAGLHGLERRIDVVVIFPSPETP
jgi:outer membrane protein OmpA-like peptidoglycan-associated protein